jgi:hypothetical protein
MRTRVLSGSDTSCALKLSALSGSTFVAGVLHSLLSDANEQWTRSKGGRRMNHAAIAGAAMRYRMGTLGVEVDAGLGDEIDRVAKVAVCRADPETDRAIRMLGTAWTRAGLDPDSIARPWDTRVVGALFDDSPLLLDALDILSSRIDCVVIG